MFKRIVSMVSALIIASTSMICAVDSVDVNAFELTNYDVNADDVIDSTDALYILSCVVGNTVDENLDGCTSEDALTILKCVIGIIPMPEIPAEEGFTADDYTVTYDKVEKHIEFDINTSSISADELEAQGYTISEDRTVASMDTVLARVTYTFDKLPSTAEELKEFSLKSDVRDDLDYGMLAPMAATIIAIHTYGIDKEECYKMLDYVYGPNQTFDNFDKNFMMGQFASEANVVLQNCYFGGATPDNSYTPDEPYTITLEEGPYYIAAQTGRPETHMAFVYFAGADNGRYMDVFKSSDGNWYAWDDNYKHLLAGVKEPTVVW